MEKKESRASFNDVLKTFWGAMRHHKVLFYFSMTTMTIGVVMELVPPLFYKKFFDVISSAPDKTVAAPHLTGIILTIFAFNLAAWASYRMSHFSINEFEAKVMGKLQTTSFDYLIDHSYSFFSNSFTGGLVQKVNRLVRSFEKLYDTLVFNLIPLVVAVFGITYVVWRQQPKIAYVIMGWAACVMTFSYFYSRWKLKYDLASAAADSKSSAYLADAISNQNTVASFAASEFESKGFKEVVLARFRAAKISWNLSTLLGLVQAAFGICTEFLLFYYGIKYWKLGIITAGTFVLIQAYILNLIMKMWNFSNIVRALYEGVADSKEMVEILETPHEIQNKPNATDIRVTEGRIKFGDIRFVFPNGREVLPGLNLEIHPGEKVALIGPSGAGKSTVVKLLTRMYDVSGGSITIDGQDLRDVTQESLRKSISLVPQDPILFHRSLMENIRYGRLDATNAEVIEAARLAHCDEFIESLPEKYETFVGERGIKLSGGERQRVAIARAILKNAPILILDEATSSLDSHSEHLIQEALDTLMQGKTAIVIAHRLSTIRKMDRIIVIEKGRVTEEGTHEDLLAKSESLYKNLWNLQAGGFIVE